MAKITTQKTQITYSTPSILHRITGFDKRTVRNVEVELDKISLRAKEGPPIPIVYGYGKVKGKISLMSQLRYEDSSYKANCMIILCMGNIYLHRIIGKNKTYINPYLHSDSDTTHALWHNLTVDYCDGIINTNTSDTTPYTTFKDDDDNVLNNSYLQSRGIAYINFQNGGSGYFDTFNEVFGQIDAGNNVPQIDFVVQKRLSNNIHHENMENGSNPAAVIFDLLYNKQYGCGVSGAYIDRDSFNSVADYFYEQGYAYNTVISDGDAVAVIEKIQTKFGCFIYKINDKYYLGAKSHTAANRNKQSYNDEGDDLYTWSDQNKDFISFSISRRGWEQAPNVFQTTFSNVIDNDESPDILLTSDNIANLQITGKRKVEKIDLDGIGDIDAASKRLAEVMRYNSYPTSTINCETTSEWIDVNVTDYINIINVENGISSETRYQVIEKRIPEYDSNVIRWVLLECPEKWVQLSHKLSAAKPMGFAAKYST